MAILKLISVGKIDVSGDASGKNAASSSGFADAVCSKEATAGLSAVGIAACWVPGYGQIVGAIVGLATLALNYGCSGDYDLESGLALINDLNNGGTGIKPGEDGYVAPSDGAFGSLGD